MTCNPTTIQLSSSGTTTINVTLSTDPGDGTDVILQVDGLSFAQTVQASSSAAVFTVTARTAANYSLWDATIQVGSNLTVDATAQVVETNGAQTIGVTITDSAVSYCSPLSGGGGGSGTVTGVTGTAPIVSSGSSTTPAISLADAGITTAKIADDAVTADKIADGVLNDGTVTSITAGSGLTGGTITTSGTIDHQAQPASGTGPAFVKSVEIDSFGHVTSVTGESTSSSYRTAIGADDASNLSTGTLAASRLPDISDSYTGQIETAADKTYTIDPYVPAARTITYFYARVKTGTGTCTAKLYNGANLVSTISVTTSSTTGLLDSSYVGVAEGGTITLEISSNNAAEDVCFAVEYTQ